MRSRASDHIAALVYSVAALFSLVKLINTLSIKYYPPHKRHYGEIVYMTLTGSHQADTYLALIFILTALSITVTLYLKRRSLEPSLRLTKIYFIGLLIAIETLAAIRWFTYPLWPTPLYSDPSWHFAYIEAQLFYALSPLSPLLMLLVLASWIIKPLAASLSKSFKITSLAKLRPDSPSPTLILPSKLLLAIAIALAISMTLYPYHPNLNPQGLRVSVDAYFYDQWLSEMLSRNPIEALRYAFMDVQGGSRPLHLILLYAVALTTHLPSYVIANFQFTFISILFVASTYLLAREALKDGRNAALAALIAAVSFNMTIGIYAGFASHWLALSIMYIALATYIRRKDSLKNAYITAALGAALIYLYAWSWTGFIAILLTYEGLNTIKQRRLSKEALKKLSLIIGIGLAANLAKTYLLSSINSVQAGAQVTQASCNLIQPINLYKNLVEATFFYLMGCYTNTPLLLAAFIGALALNLNDAGHRMLMSIVIPVSIIAIFSSYGLYAHLLLNLPIPILAAYAVKNPKTQRQENIILPTTLLILLNLNYTLRILASITTYF